MNEVLAAHPDPDLQIHVVLDNLNTHKPKHDRWLARHRNVHFHFTPTHAHGAGWQTSWTRTQSRLGRLVSTAESLLFPGRFNPRRRVEVPHGPSQSTATGRGAAG